MHQPIHKKNEEIKELLLDLNNNNNLVLDNNNNNNNLNEDTNNMYKISWNIPSKFTYDM